MWNRPITPAGRFRFRCGEQRWEWSRELATLYGYPADTVAPSAELLLTHEHPGDRTAIADTLTRILETGQALSSEHRIIDTDGALHDVLVVGDRWNDSQGRAIGARGYYIDVTNSIAEVRKAAIDDILPGLVAGRQVIEQAKGALMLVYGISAERAFQVLTWRSQETNVKLRALAAELVASLTRFGGATTATRTRFDHLLLTAHEFG
ncbi:PAS and ANTAR domain-containing protein [Nocardia sp. NPDC006044]|uniref:PAS and ANTAR domain-containing protein n=1 Tax=Nocardia sp. NPDC006044 TaxID=3364306 RepID=UPI0036C2C72F